MGVTAVKANILGVTAAGCLMLLPASQCESHIVASASEMTARHNSVTPFSGRARRPFSVTRLCARQSKRSRK